MIKTFQDFFMWVASLTFSAKIPVYSLKAQERYERVTRSRQAALDDFRDE